MAKFNKGDYLIRIDDNRNVAWKVHRVDSNNYILTALNHYNHTAFPVGSDHLFSFLHVESYYKFCTYEKIVAKII